jgi:L-lactate dehydrogenase complex protein LldE
MASDKLESIRRTRCDGFVSADCGCLLNLNLTLEKQKQDKLRGEHIATFIRTRMDCAGGGA